MFLRCIIAALTMSLATAGVASDSNGFLTGHLRILSLKEVERADEPAAGKPFAKNYSDYPLIILSPDGKKEIARVTADDQGDYRVALPPGVYILDVQGRGRGHVRAKPQHVTILPNQTVTVDMDIDTGIR
jgi:hypothetical protein